MSLPYKKNIYKVPPNYFGEMNKQLYLNLEEEELFEASEYPLLHSINKNNDYSLPENYFENFKVPFRNSKVRILSSILKHAAMIILVIGLGVIFKFNTSNPANIAVNYEKAELDLLSDVSILEFEDLDLEDLLALVSNDLDLATINDEELIEFLLLEIELDDLNDLQ